MAIKRLLRSTEIADSPFRSLQDVEKYLDRVKEQVSDEDQILRKLEQQFSRSMAKAASTTFSIQREPLGPKKSPSIDAIKVDKVVIPKLDDLKQNFTIADELSDQVDRLNTLHAQVSTSFRGVRGANETMKNILAMKTAVQQKLDRALNFLSKIGTNHAPTHFKNMVQETCTAISEELTFSGYSTAIYATTNEVGDILFTEYVKLENLEEENGEQYVEFYVVFTALLSPHVGGDKGAMSAKYFITVMHSFQTPGKFNPGKQFTDVKGAMGQLGRLLSIENITNSIGSLPHNIPPEKFTKDRFRTGDLVADIKVDSDSITFVFLKNVNQEQAQGAANSLFAEIKPMLQAAVKGAIVKPKLIRDAKDRRYAIRFTLGNAAQHNQVDSTQIDFLKERFGLDDKQIRKVIDIING